MFPSADSSKSAVDMFTRTDTLNSRLYCAQIVGWVSTSFDNIDDERRLFDGFVK